jgi:hypothetical protein
VANRRSPKELSSFYRAYFHREAQFLSIRRNWPRPDSGELPELLRRNNEPVSSIYKKVPSTLPNRYPPLLTPETPTPPPLNPAGDPPFCCLSSLYEHCPVSASSFLTSWLKESTWGGGNRARRPLLHHLRPPCFPFVMAPSDLLRLHRLTRV